MHQRHNLRWWLLLFYSGFSGFFLWNPAVAESKVVPYPKLTKSPAHLAIKPSPANPIARYAFGHDHNSNDYKVLRIVNYKGASERNQQSRNLVHVYSPSTGSWRQIMNTPIDHSNIIMPDFLKFAYLNGVHHWCSSIFVTDDDGNRKFTKVIISFDMSREVCGLMRYPIEVFNKQSLLQQDGNACFVQ